MGKYNFKKLLVVSFLFVATLFYACDKTTSETENITTSIISSSPIEFASEGESKKFLLKTNDTWTVTTDSEWVTLSETSGKGSVNIIITAKENIEDVVRNGKVNIVSGGFSQSIDIVQSEVAPYIITDESSRLLSPFAGRVTIQVRANVPYTVVAEGTWMRQVETKAVTENSFTFAYDENLDADRENVILIKNSAGEVKCSIAVKQFGSKEGKVSKIYDGGMKSPVNIVVIGDGFTYEDNVEGGLFDREVKKMIDNFFGVEPLTTYKKYFAIYQVYANSVDRGADLFPHENNPELDIKNTAFDCTYNSGGTERLLVVQNRAKAEEYIRKAVAKESDHLRIVLVNDSKYGGSGGPFAVASLHPQSSLIAIHELGHLLGLADEYVDEEYAKIYNITPADAVKWPNVDITNDMTKIKWKHFNALPGYNEKAIEGGYYLAKGVWRPWENSIMRDNKGGFNAISRETIVKQIMKWTGETYSFDEFLKNDVLPQSAPMSLSEFSLEKSYPMPVPLEVYVKKEDMPSERNKQLGR